MTALTNETKEVDLFYFFKIINTNCLTFKMFIIIMSTFKNLVFQTIIRKTQSLFLLRLTAWLRIDYNRGLYSTRIMFSYFCIVLQFLFLLVQVVLQIIVETRSQLVEIIWLLACREYAILVGIKRIFL